jgi:hypothetical protein
MSIKPTPNTRPEAMIRPETKTRQRITIRPRTEASKEASTDKQLLAAQKLRQNKDGSD